MKKLHISLIFSNLVVVKSLSLNIIAMHNFIAKFRKILEICKQYAGNQVNEKGNVPRRGVVPTFSDLEVVALSITAEAFSIDSENYLFVRLNSECPNAIPNLITRRQYNQRRKLTRLLGENIPITDAVLGFKPLIVSLFTRFYLLANNIMYFTCLFQSFYTK